MSKWTVAAGVFFRDGRPVPSVNILSILNGNEKVLTALRQYGIHTVVCCEVQVDGVPWKCTCGYAAAIAAAAGASDDQK